MTNSLIWKVKDCSENYMFLHSRNSLPESRIYMTCHFWLRYFIWYAYRIKMPHCSYRSGAQKMNFWLQDWGKTYKECKALKLSDMEEKQSLYDFWRLSLVRFLNLPASGPSISRRSKQNKSLQIYVEWWNCSTITEALSMVNKASQLPTEESLKSIWCLKKQNLTPKWQRRWRPPSVRRQTVLAKVLKK